MIALYSGAAVAVAQAFSRVATAASGVLAGTISPPAEIPWARVKAELPSSGEPIVRSRAFYDIREPLGLRYDYDFQPFTTDKAWDDAFFGYLTSIAVDHPLTLFQEL